MRLGKTHALERSQRYLGRTLEVLVEERNVKMPQQVKGRIDQGRPVYLEVCVCVCVCVCVRECECVCVCVCV